MAVKPLGAVLALSSLKGRLAGSAAERAAIDEVGRWFEERGEVARYEGFVECTSPPLNAALHLAVAALGALLGTLWAPAGLVLVILAGLSAIRELRGERPWLRRLLPRDTSYNVLVRRPAAGHAKGTLVLATHVDVPRRTWRLSRRLALGPLGIAGALALVLALETIGVGWFWLGTGQAIAGGALLLGALLALYQHARPPGPGRGDSGVAALLEAAIALEERPLEHLEVVLVATGSQEAHGGGVRALLRQHRQAWTPADTALLFVEDVGRGELAYGFAERLLRHTAYRPTLPGVAERLARRLPWREVSEVTLDRFTGALLPTLEGYRAMTITGIGGDEGPLNPTLIRKCAAFLAEVAWLYDADQGET